MCSLYNDELSFWMELKLEIHLNSITAQLVELCHQLPGTSCSDVIETINAQNLRIDFSAYKRTLELTESQSNSKCGSETSGSGSNDNFQ